MKVGISILLALFAICRNGQAQGFINLNFEDANNLGASDTFGQVPATNAFPGWTVSAEYIVYDDFSLSGNSISICDTNSNLSFPEIQGKYFALFSAAQYQGGPSISLGQTGQIPLSAQSIEFWGIIGGMQIAFDGQQLSFDEIGSTAGYNIYAANISAYAGEIGQLLFTLPPQPYPNPSLAELDNIHFLSTSVPEPNTLGLYALGGLFFMWRYRQKFSKIKV